jgi:hypothetical protein
MKKVYLCGAINGCTDAQACGWRETVKTRMSAYFEWLDPMRRDYRGREDQSVREIISGDEADLAECDIVLAAADLPSWGTAMEIRAAAVEFHKPIIVICGAQRVSPWLRGHATHLVTTLEDALTVLGSMQ